VTRHVSRVLPSDAGSVRWRVEVAGGALFKLIEEEKGLGGWAPAPRRGIPTVLISDSAISVPDDVIASVAAFHARRARPAPPDTPGRDGGYRPETLKILFGETP
jgi:hypothetical protein